MRLIHPGDNLSIVGVGVGCMMRSDIDVFVLIYEEILGEAVDGRADQSSGRLECLFCG